MWRMLKVRMGLSLVLLTAACGDDGGSDGDGVSIPEVTITCETDLCAQASGGDIVFFAYVFEDCATALGSSSSITEAAGRGSQYSCAAGACTGSSDDSPSAWDDDDDVDVTQIPAGTYSVVAWLDHNGNLTSGTGPDIGDTLCCLSTDVSANTSSVNLLSPDCTDLLE